MNAKKELLKALEGKALVKCATIYQEDSSYNSINRENLPINYTAESYNRFFEKLDFEYDNSWGCQELFGTIWLEDGTWLSRAEYDGSEWWRHNKLPEIPNELLKTNNHG